MCGIAGLASHHPIQEETLSALRASLRHRGPDDEGDYVDPGRRIALVHTRLSVIDLSPAGHQPMPNEDESLWVTYNGEIYNFQELRRELLAKGHTFRSQTDTEVLLHLYEEEGEDLVQRLVGMFAFALYDRKRGRLFLARDRLGIKPLYYAQRNGDFIFASEIKGILAAGTIPAEVNWQAVWDYFTFSFVPHPETAFEGILQLPPAHTLTLDLTGGRLSLRRYWNPLENAGRPRRHSYGDLREQVRELLTDSVRGEMVSDVPLGLFFSGGIDSTLLAALMSRETTNRVKTFTVVFPGSGPNLHDDLPYARLASRALGTEHHELPVALTTLEEFLETVQLVDQPFGNPTLYLQYLIAKATRREVTVALSGVGSDELFGGYPKYTLLPWAPFLRLLPPPAGTLLHRILSLVREDVWVPTLRRAKRLLRGVGAPLSEQYLHWAYYLSEKEKALLFEPSARLGRPDRSVRIIEKILSRVPAGTDRYGQIFSAEMETFLADNLLEYTDKATMAVALETRVPFLDHRLVELGARIPFHDKIRRGRTKVILTDAFRDILPREIVEAPKRGFSPPLAGWMEAVLDRYFDNILNRKTVEKDGIFHWESIQALRSAHRKRRRDASMELTAVLMFDVWYRRYILRAHRAL